MGGCTITIQYSKQKNLKAAMILMCKPFIRIIPFIRFETYQKDSVVFVKTKLFNKILLIIKNHFIYQFKILTCVSGVDTPENLYRFTLVYELLSIRYNSRVRIKILADELTPICSIEKIFANAAWWESEIWDMFGIFFINQLKLSRILTDYGFQGYPLRKDFPLSGFLESRFNILKNKVVYEKLELSQKYRTFEYACPWKN
jgi:NADH:ubiquinone oxidoreductase subunit C